MDSVKVTWLLVLKHFQNVPQENKVLALALLAAAALAVACTVRPKGLLPTPVCYYL